jgi:hypothetical protein
MQSVLYDAAGRRRSLATMPGFHEGHARGTKVGGIPLTLLPSRRSLRHARGRRQRGGDRFAHVDRGLVAVGSADREALDLAETDLDATRGAVLVQRGEGGRRREVGMDRWAWSQLQSWLAVRRRLPVGALLCVVRGVSAGRHWEPSSARKQLGAHRSPGGCAATVRAPSAASCARCRDDA